MIIARTPVRISFLGGGTDYPAYFRRHGGATLVTTIDKYTYVTVRPLAASADHRLVVYYDRVEQVQTRAAIQHPGVRECLRFLGIEQGVAIHLASDLPVCTGLGSSSSFTIGLLKALHLYKGEQVTAETVAQEAIYMEQTLLQERVGCQDQVACAHGGLLQLRFGRNDQIGVTPIILCDEQRTTLRQWLMLFDTGLRRRAHVVLSEQLTRTAACVLDAELAALAGLVEEGVHLMTQAGNLSAFGALLHEGWLLKRRLSHQVSNAYVDVLYRQARQAGATGGKLLGAGGGGFLLLFVEPAVQAAVRHALADLREVKFQFEDTGSQIVACGHMDIDGEDHDFRADGCHSCGWVGDKVGARCQ